MVIAEQVAARHKHQHFCFSGTAACKLLFGQSYFQTANPDGAGVICQRHQGFALKPPRDIFPNVWQSHINQMFSKKRLDFALCCIAALIAIH
jgi:hypothetical protein